jgi:hypothetical protein
LCLKNLNMPKILLQEIEGNVSYRDIVFMKNS